MTDAALVANVGFRPNRIARLGIVNGLEWQQNEANTIFRGAP